MDTLADKVAEANAWPHAMALGYMDGLRDRKARMQPALHRSEMTEYAHGYFRGYAIDPTKAKAILSDD